MSKTTEALKLAEEALVYHTQQTRPIQKTDEAIAAICEALAEQDEQEPVAWHDKIKGMEVSVDVSTGEDDATHWVFGRVDSVMLESCGAQEDIILVIEEIRNYAAPVDAKSIRAEALEEAAAMGEESIRIWGDQDGRMVEVVAAIRRLK